MTTNLKFPSNSKKEIDFTPGFTAAEKRYLSRAKKKKLELIDWFLLFILVAAILFLALTVERTFFRPNLPRELHAQETLEQIRNNSWYCKEVASGRMQVDPNDVNPNQLLALCAEYI